MLTNAIEAAGVWKCFERGKPVLKNVSLSIAPGEMVALIGASGSGKSTLIRAIAGLAPTDRRAPAIPRNPGCSTTTVARRRNLSGQFMP